MRLNLVLQFLGGLWQESPKILDCLKSHSRAQNIVQMPHVKYSKVLQSSEHQLRHGDYDFMPVHRALWKSMPIKIFSVIYMKCTAYVPYLKAKSWHCILFLAVGLIPRGVLGISSDGPGMIKWGQKSIPKKIPRASNKTQNNLWTKKIPS